MTKIKKTLQSLGLDKEESEIYTLLLNKKDLPAYQIAKETSIPRTTVYSKLISLEKKQLVNSWIKKKVKFFSIENPEILSSQIKQKQNDLDTILPEMLNLYKNKFKIPSAKTYEGIDGIKQIFENLINTIKLEKIREIYVYSNPFVTEKIPKFYREWKKRKDKTECKTLLIVPPETVLNADYMSDKFRETRKLKYSFSYSGSMIIFNNHISFISYNDKIPYGITIESNIISEMLKNFFMNTWYGLDK